MKNLLDKLSKICIYLIPVLMVTTISLNSDANLSNSTKVNPQPPIEIANNIQSQDTLVDNEVERMEPIIKKKQTSMSRGGGVGVKHLTEREVINNYVREICSKYNIEPELIMSVIQTESGYNPKAKNGNCLGLMQVSSYWHRYRAAELGVKDFYDPYSNILVGVDYISELLKIYKDPRLVLMLYNMNHDTALKMYRNGQISEYAKTILSRAEQYKKGE